MKGSLVNYGSARYRVMVYRQRSSILSGRPIIGHYSNLVAIDAMNHSVRCIA